MKQAIVDLNCIETRRSRRTVLNIEHLSICAGEMVAVLGPNGSGKSTLLQVLNTLLPYDSGVLRIFGQDAKQADKRALRLRSSLVFQDSMLLKDTVYNNVALPLKFRGITAHEAKQKVNDVLAAFRCAHLAERQAGYLSGGETQRVCLARALVSEPELLLLDEPFAALDPSTRVSMLFDLRQLAVQRNMTVLLVSHHFNEVLDFAGRAVVLQEGCIVQDDRPEAILRRPVNEVVAKLIGMDNILACQVEQNAAGNVVRLADNISFLWCGDYNGQRLCCLPGDALELYGEDIPGDKRRHEVIEGIVRQVSPGIGIYRVMVEVSGLSLVARVPRECAEKLAVDGRVYVCFNSEEFHLI